jgi:hypothetical protein
MRQWIETGQKGNTMLMLPTGAELTRDMKANRYRIILANMPPHFQTTLDMPISVARILYHSSSESERDARWEDIKSQIAAGALLIELHRDLPYVFTETDLFASVEGEWNLAEGIVTTEEDDHD